MAAKDDSTVSQFSAALNAAASTANRNGALVAQAASAETGELALFAGLRANFIAHLIATARHLPQTRVLRRAAPEIASAHYRPVRQSTVSRTLSRKA